jgi:glyoxylase-like metal-dependent hydrolase (beta-lactamase superfamily II)
VILRQLFEPTTSTFTYLLACPRTHEAVLVDPVAGEADTYVALLAELGLTLRWTLDTHVHADHITAADTLRQRLGSRTALGAGTAVACADLLLEDGATLAVGDLRIEARATPGHTDGCTSYVVGDCVFTGDALLIGGCGRTDFQQGDAGRLWDSIHGRIFTLPPDTRLYPGHDYRGNTVSTVGAEQASNARLGGGRSRESFQALMAELRLPPPRFLEQALPANLACGRAPSS